jgi:hypothetical protein
MFASRECQRMTHPPSRDGAIGKTMQPRRSQIRLLVDAMATATLLDNVIRHLGGEERLRTLGARVSVNDDTHISVKLLHPNPRGVRSVIITGRSNGFFDIDCFGPLRPSAFSAPLVDKADNILPENLAAVLGKLTGDERLHHRHY